MSYQHRRAACAFISRLWVFQAAFVAFFIVMSSGITQAVELVSASAAADWTILVTWTAPGDDGNMGTAAEYDIRYATFAIDESNWNSATQVTGERTPKSAGSVDSFAITGLAPLTTYYIGIKTRDEAYNWSPLSNVISKTTSLVTGIGDEGQLPGTFHLRQNFPNPFNPGTTIECTLPAPAHLSLTIFNLLGQQVTRLVDRALPAGDHTFSWDGTDRFGRLVASGVYLYRMEADGFVRTRSMTLLR